MSVGGYARVSTHDRQTLGLHLRAMRSYAQDRGWAPVQQIEDVGSGPSQSARFFDGSPSGLALQLSDELWNATIVTPVA
ncbi:MAG: recombinase family protein [Singulisphaera sp.]